MSGCRPVHRQVALTLGFASVVQPPAPSSTFPKDKGVLKNLARSALRPIAAHPLLALKTCRAHEVVEFFDGVTYCVGRVFGLFGKQLSGRRAMGELEGRLAGSNPRLNLRVQDKHRDERLAALGEHATDRAQNLNRRRVVEMSKERD